MTFAFGKGALATVLAVWLTGCATHLQPAQLTKVQSVGVIDDFPAVPNYAVVGTTIFNNDFDDINAPHFKKLLEQTAMRALTAKGYQPEIISQDQQQQFDLVLKLEPAAIPDMLWTWGYGVYQRSEFTVPKTAVTYMAIKVLPYIHGKLLCSDCYYQQQLPLLLKKLPANWQALSSQQQAVIGDTLESTIEYTVSGAFKDMGLTPATFH
ncbi:hypothetical protein [Gallaecimonas mangrovi]|uniref:hypothetical protein n=1 Tax=Gallaecimonas mangrovi TaxID=2291597 RepID=UPI000E2015EB|nr:hypothetical protein [Gallaecimonas mangrovi]